LFGASCGSFLAMALYRPSGAGFIESSEHATKSTERILAQLKPLFNGIAIYLLRNIFDNAQFFAL
jgi:hypothetical protein